MAMTIREGSAGKFTVRYIFRQDQETGNITVEPIDKSKPITPEEFQFIKDVVRWTIKNRKRKEQAPEPPPKIVYDEEIEIDPCVIELDNIRKDKGWTRRQVADAIMVKENDLGAMVRGNVRALIGRVRLWALVSGWHLTIIPLPLRGQVRAIVEEWQQYQEELENSE